MYKSLADLKKHVESLNTQKRLVLSAADDPHSLDAVVKAQSEGLIEAILVGDGSGITKIAENLGIRLDGIKIIDEPDTQKAIEKSIRLINEGGADILMKGKSSTAGILKGILNKEWGMRKGQLLSHFALFEIPTYHKLLALTDVAININPGLQDKISILENALGFMNGLGWDCPKVAVISAVEVVNPSIQSSVDAAALAMMSVRRQFKNCIVDGPMALDSAVNRESAHQKKILSDVGGDADLILFPQLESGNVMYKTLAFLAGGLAASVVLGASAPVVLTSRADSMESKMNSILLAAAEGTSGNS